MRLFNYIFAILMIVLGAYITITSYLMGGLSAVFPKLTGISLFIISILLLVVISLDKNKVNEYSPLDRDKVLKVIYSIILLIIYSIIIRLIGTYISTVLLFIGMALILTEDLKEKSVSSHVKLVITSLVIVGVIYSIFKFLLNVPLTEIF